MNQKRLLFVCGWTILNNCKNKVLIYLYFQIVIMYKTITYEKNGLN